MELINTLILYLSQDDVPRWWIEWSSRIFLDSSQFCR